LALAIFASFANTRLPFTNKVGDGIIFLYYIYLIIKIYNKKQVIMEKSFNAPEGFGLNDFLLFIEGIIILLKFQNESVLISATLLHMPPITKYIIQFGDTKITIVYRDDSIYLVMTADTEDKMVKKMGEAIEQFLPNYTKPAFEELRDIDAS
jgi:hypothetical protein